MEDYGDFFPDNPETLDELLESMAQQMAAMQAMLNSMSPEQRAQLMDLSNQLLEDMDLNFEASRLGQNLQQLFPQAGWQQGYDFSGFDPLGMADASQMMRDLAQLDQRKLPQAIEFTGSAVRGRHGRRSTLLGDGGRQHGSH
ncbi:MAG: hypothetical protein R2706_15100 [Acidimicrobiales bacterium]